MIQKINITFACLWWTWLHRRHHHRVQPTTTISIRENLGLSCKTASTDVEHEPIESKLTEFLICSSVCAPSQCSAAGNCAMTSADEMVAMKIRRQAVPSNSPLFVILAERIADSGSGTFTISSICWTGLQRKEREPFILFSSRGTLTLSRELSLTCVSEPMIFPYTKTRLTYIRIS